MVRILRISSPGELKRIMQEIRVDPYGIDIMAPKGIAHLIRVDSLSCIEANILKQEMLSLGGDAALARHALGGGRKKTDCLIIGNLSQFARLNDKLNKQPFGLNELAKVLSASLANYHKRDFVLELGRYKLNLGRAVKIMGIVNLTPDSFSGDGFYQGGPPQAGPPSAEGFRVKGSEIIEYAQKMVEDGADIIDIGGESSRPGARPVSVKEELSRTIPVIKALAKKIKVPLSIDTYKPEVAAPAIDSGAVMVNDITGLRHPKMRKLISAKKAGVVIMHMKGAPCTMQKSPVYASVTGEIVEFLERAVKCALDAGIAGNRIVIDPGIGFGKTCAHNLQILKGLAELKILGYPILVGPSRKSFIGKILNADPEKRVFGTVAACILALQNGAQMLRVHDVKQVSEALRISEAILNS